MSGPDIGDYRLAPEHPFQRPTKADVDFEIGYFSSAVRPRAANLKAARSAATAVFFTSDTHFGHGGALGLYRRPFASVAAMNEAIVARWNETVGVDDEVWHLGDFAIRQSADVVAGLLARLNGRKHLVTGNNDPPATTGQSGWTSVQPYAELVVDNVPLVLCHYPFRSWCGMDKGWLDLHGHSHGRMKPLPRQYDVGVDVWEFRPVSVSGITARAARRSASGTKYNLS